MTYTTEHSRSSFLASHRHSRSYLCLVLKGIYEERCVDGQFVIKAGTLVYHPRHHLHTNSFRNSSALVLNLDIQLQEKTGFASIHVPKFHREIENLMKRQSSRLVPLVEDLISNDLELPEPVPGWIDDLSEVLRDSSDHRTLEVICRDIRISPEHASREFRRHFDASPSQFRREYRLRSACRALSAGIKPALAAQGAGFADQSHMGRVLKRAIGLTPAEHSLTRANQL